ncbi:GPW/gp25 family protein [Kribbella catacumbae]|uniref:GPW/gp25 family protein n=1 Tax=Kribbella catacumbae TaxID=460086 RepID=UPI000368B60E|nr:GPW/gp25 family protein [Kribbella catacumbae]
MDFDALFGADIRLLGDLEFAEQRERGTDLLTANRPVSSKVDLQRLTGVEDLQQALLLRFLTQVGELAHLGHPEYGSRLHELVGEPNTQTIRNRAKLFALQALQAEPRIAAVQSVTVTTGRGPRRAGRVDLSHETWLEIKAVVVTIGEPTALNLVIPVNLGGSVA